MRDSKNATNGPDGKALSVLVGEISWEKVHGHVHQAIIRVRLHSNQNWIAASEGLTTRPSRMSFELLVCLD